MQHDVGNSIDLAIYRMKIASEDLNTAIRNLEEEDYRAANNRAYYAIFHAIDACLAMKNLAFKKHGQAIGAFNKEYIMTGIFPKDFGRKINQAEEIRRRSDYDDFFIVSKKNTQEQVEFAKEAVKALSNYLKERMDSEE